jgi:hypothetical protein
VGTTKLSAYHTPPVGKLHLGRWGGWMQGMDEEKQKSA